MEILVIFNPESGNRPYDVVKGEFEENIKQYKVDYRVIETSNIENIYNEAKTAANNNTELIIAIGGDGTVNQIINAIALSSTTLGIVPTGTGNLLATSLGIPVNIAKALQIIFEGKRKKIDLGNIDGRFFSIIAGCGFDASIMKNVNRTSKKYFGILAYFIEGFKLAFAPKKAIFRLTIDGKKIKKRAINVLIVNTGTILGNLITIVPDASTSDGLLDVCIFSPDHTGEYIPVIWNILTKQNYQTKRRISKMYHYKAKKIRLECRPKLPIQADGDLFGLPPINIEVHAAALNICIPQKVDTFVMDPENFFKSLLEKTFSI